MSKKNGWNTADGLLNFMDYNKFRYRLLYWGMFAILSLLTLSCLLPVIWVALSSFKDTAQMYRIPPTLMPDSFSLSAVVAVWQKVRFERYVFNSVYLIAGCLVMDVFFNGIAGYVLSRVRMKGVGILETLIFWTMMLPGISMVPLYMTFVDMPLIHINLTGSFLPIWLMAGANAFNILLCRNFFNGIPKDYFEAARIDGCGNLGIFMRIVLPMSKPLLAVVSIMSITSSWSNFLWPYLLLGNTSKEPISVLLYQITSNSTMIMQDNQVMMIMILSIIPPLLVYSLFSKQIMGGFNMSGIKG